MLVEIALAAAADLSRRSRSCANGIVTIFDDLSGVPIAGADTGLATGRAGCDKVRTFAA
jgi:hypothetical protein